MKRILKSALLFSLPAMLFRKKSAGERRSRGELRKASPNSLH